MMGEKRYSKAGAIAYALLIMLVLGAIQVVSGVASTIPYAVRAYLEANGDMNLYAQNVKNIGTDIRVLTMAIIAATVLNVVLGLLWYYLAVIRKKDPAVRQGRTAFLENRSAILFVIGGTLALHVIAMVISVLVQTFVAPNDPAYSLMAETLAESEQPVAMLITAAFLGPVAEECFFRGLMINRLRKSFGIAACLLINTALFSLMHFNIVQGLYVIPMSLFMGYLAYHYHSVVPSLLCHLISNLIGMTVDEILGTYPLLMLGLLLIGCVVAVLTWKRVPELRKGVEDPITNLTE